YVACSSTTTSTSGAAVMDDEIEPVSSDEIELISDGDGVAVIAKPAAVQRFLTSGGLSSMAIELPSFGSALRTGSAAAQAGSEIAANSGRWLKLTQESAAKIKQYGLTD